MISVVIPVYNAEKYISSTLGCILNQTYQDFELILVNDGSTDGTMDIAEDYARRDERIRLFTQKNAGPSAARNHGIDVCRGDWVYFMDSDDTIANNMLESMIKRSQSADIVITGVRRHIEEHPESDCNLMLKDRDISTNNQEGFREFLTETIRNPSRGVFFYYIWNKLIRSSIIKSHNIRFREDMSYGEDFFFLCDLYKAAENISIVSDILYHYYIRGSATLVGRFHQDELQFRNSSYARMKDLFAHFHALEINRDELHKHEGLCTLSALNKINSSTCYLDKKGKLHYIKGLLQNDRKNYIVAYLREQKGRRAEVKRIIFQLGNEHLVYYVLTYKQ